MPPAFGRCTKTRVPCPAVPVMKGALP